MAQTRRRGGSRKRLSVFKDITGTLSPKTGKNRLPVFKLLTSSANPSSRSLLNKSINNMPNILDVAGKYGLNVRAKSFKPTKGKGKRKRKRKGTRKK